MVKETVLKKILSSKPLSYLLALLLFFALVSLGREINRQINLKKEFNYLKEQAATLESENQKLTNELEKTETEYFKEKAARLKLGLRKPGERMIVVIAPENLDRENTSNSRYLKNKISNFKIWWQHFFPVDNGTKNKESQ